MSPQWTMGVNNLATTVEIELNVKFRGTDMTQIVTNPILEG